VNCARSTIDDHDEKEKEVFFGPTTSQLIWCHDSATIYHADFCCNAAVNRTVLPPLAFSIVVFAMALVGEAPSLRDGDDATTAQCLLGKTATLSLSLSVPLWMWMALRQTVGGGPPLFVGKPRLTKAILCCAFLARTDGAE